MNMRTHVVLCGLAICAWVASATPLAAQARGARGGAAAVQGGRTGGPATATATANAPDDPFQGPVVTNAPFSADATTTVTQVLSDGTRIGETTNARFYRDTAGRVRREQSVLGLGALNPSGEPMTTITVDPDPGDATAYTLDPVNKTARRVSRSGNSGAVFVVNSANWVNGPLVINTDGGRLYAVRDGAAAAYTSALGADRQNVDVGRRTRIGNGVTVVPGMVAGPAEALGTRQMEGLTVVGKRTKMTIPTGQIGNDRPIEITDERWESPDLKLLVRSHHHDPRTGDVEYRLTNIVRVEPSADLFQVPSDYTVQDGAVPLQLALPGERTGGAGGRTGGARTGGARSGAPAN